MWVIDFITINPKYPGVCGEMRLNSISGFTGCLNAYQLDLGMFFSQTLAYFQGLIGLMMIGDNELVTKIQDIRDCPFNIDILIANLDASNDLKRWHYLNSSTDCAHKIPSGEFSPRLILPAENREIVPA